MRQILIGFLFVMLCFPVLADTPPKPEAKPAETKPALTNEESARLKQISIEFDRAEMEKQIVELKLQLQQEKFARLLAEVRLKNNCPQGVLNPQSGDFTCPPKPEEKKPDKN